LSNPDVVMAIGECGLDYVDASTEVKIIQNKFFHQQLELAVELKKPVFVHERMAFHDCVEVLKQFRGKLPAVVVNCFTGSETELDEYISLDSYIGITGILCNDDRGPHLKKLVRKIPLNRLLLGSDAPYLTPFNMSRPFPKRNEPQSLPFTLWMLAECLQMDINEVASITTKNARALFKMSEILYDGTGSSLKIVASNELEHDIEIGKDGKQEEQQKQDNENIKRREEETPSVPLIQKEIPSIIPPSNSNTVLPASNPNIPIENLFIYKGKCYSVNPKEKSILENQQQVLNEETFDRLFKDFQLKEVEQ